MKLTTENPHGNIIIRCPICGWNNCRVASQGSPECCWCVGKEWGYNLAEPCCFSNWKKEREIWRNTGKNPKRIRELIRLKTQNLNDILGKVKK